MINVRSNTLNKYLDGKSIRLSKSDRAFLSDLSRVSIIDSRDADINHYKDNITGAGKRLDKLVDCGLLSKHKIYNPNAGIISAYSFKTPKIAQLFGGEKINIGKRRSGLHDVITSKVYFSQGRPDTFKIESRFSKKEEQLFNMGSGIVAGRELCIPDAYYVENGEMILVESDSGQYNQTQINGKQAAWKGYKQIWGRPVGVHTKVDSAVLHEY
jgi:hypothetical protein